MASELARQRGWEQIQRRMTHDPDYRQWVKEQQQTGRNFGLGVPTRR